MKKFNKFLWSNLILVLFILFSFCLVYGEENKEDIEQQAISCLEESRQIMQEMLTENFSVGRVNDSLKIAQNFFD